MKIRENEGYFEVKLSSITEEDIVRAIDFAINDSGYTIPKDSIILFDVNYHLDFILDGLLCRIVVSLEDNFFSFGVHYTEEDKDRVLLYDLITDIYNEKDVKEYMIKQKQYLEEVALGLLKNIPKNDLEEELRAFSVEKPEHTFNEHRKDILVYALMTYMKGIFFHKMRTEKKKWDMGFGIIIDMD